MSKNALVMIFAVLVIVVATVMLLERTPETDQVQDLLFPALESNLNAITSVVIKGGNDTALVMIEKKDDTWVVPQKSSYPADVGKLREILLKLARAKRLEQKTSKPELYSKLGVEDISGETPTGLLIAATAADQAYELIVGNTLVSGGENSYVRDPKATASWLVNQDLTIQGNPVEWLDREIMDLSRDRVQKVQITTGATSLTLTKDNRAQRNFNIKDIPEGREPSYDSVANPVGTALTSLELDDVRASGDLGEAEFQAQYSCFDGLIVTVKGFVLEDAKWIQMSAALDAEQAQAFFEAPEMESLEDDTQDDSDVASSGPDLTGVESEIKELNDRVSGWSYVIPDYKYDQMNKDMENMLNALE